MERANEGWKHIPLVKLGEMLKQMIWFSGDYILNISRAAYEQSRLDDGNNYWIPKEASLDIQYKKRQIMIECVWETRETPYYSAEKCPDRFAIGISEPHHHDFQIPRWRVSNKIRYTHSRYYSTAIDRIEDAIYDAQKVIDEEIADEEKEKEQLSKAKLTKDRLCKSLDVKIGCAQYCREFRYREDDDYHIYFESSDNGDSEHFTINEIGGEYTEKEIKKIIEIVGGNPRAIAERLSK